MWFWWARWRYVRKRTQKVVFNFNTTTIADDVKVIIVTDAAVDIPAQLTRRTHAVILLSESKKDIHDNYICITREERGWFKPLNKKGIRKLLTIDGAIVIVNAKKITPEILHILLVFRDRLVICPAERHWLGMADVLMKPSRNYLDFLNEVGKIFHETSNLAEKQDAYDTTS